MTLTGTARVWHVALRSEQLREGWLDFEHGLCGVDCTICGPNAGQRRIARNLSKAETVLLESVLGCPAPVAVFRNVIARWKQHFDLGQYEPAPGDVFSGANWVGPPAILGGAIYAPVNSILVLGQNPTSHLERHDFRGLSLMQLSACGRRIPFWELIVEHGPWDVKLKSDAAVPQCEECSRRLQPVSYSPQRERSFWWNRSEFPQESLPDVDVIRSPLQRGVICSERFFTVLTEAVDVSNFDVRPLDAVASTYNEHSQR